MFKRNHVSPVDVDFKPRREETHLFPESPMPSREPKGLKRPYQAPDLFIPSEEEGSDMSEKKCRELEADKGNSLFKATKGQGGFGRSQGKLVPRVAGLFTEFAGVPQHARRADCRVIGKEEAVNSDLCANFRALELR